MEPVRVVWAGVIVVVQPSASAGAPPAAPWSAAGHDAILHQVSAWLAGLRHGVQAAPPLPTFQVAAPLSRPAPAPPASEDETPLPGFYL
jgi:hypothetical protein